jgi:hypothetical protein
MPKDKSTVTEQWHFSEVTGEEGTHIPTVNGYNQ